MYKFSEYLENRDPKLYESIGIDEAGLMDLGRNLWQGAKQLWQGVKQGSQAAYSQVAGPKVKYDNAVDALKKALDAISKDPNWKDSTTTGVAGGVKAMPMVRWLDQTIKELESQASQVQNKQMPGTIPTTAAKPAPGADFDPSGVKP
jgi:hypothetical protein